MNHSTQDFLKNFFSSFKTNGFRNSFMTAFLLLYAIASNAQFPIQVTPVVLPPYTVQLSGYYSGTAPKISITLTNVDLNKPVIDVSLRMTIGSQSIQLKSKSNINYPSISLNAGVPYTLTTQELAYYFNPDNLDFTGISKSKYQQNGIIPEGFYTFCFEVIEKITGLPSSNKQCTYVAISLNDPPLLNLPNNNVQIESTDPTNILFSWTPRHLSSPNSNFNTQYNFQLVEFLDKNISADVAFRTGQPLYSTTTTTTSLLYGPLQPLLQSGKKYGWRVQATNTIGNESLDMYKNNGYSEVYAFTYQDICHAPSGVSANILQNGNISVSWQQARIINEYVFQYRLSNQNGWNTIRSIRPDFLIENVISGETYEYRCGNNCKKNEETVYDNVRSIAIPAPVFSKNSIHGRITWTYKESEELEDTSSAPLVTKLQVDTLKRISLNLNDKVGKKLYYLQGAVVKISAANAVLATCKTNASGYFEALLDEKLLNDILTKNTKVSIEVTHPSGLFNSSKKTITSRPPIKIIKVSTKNVQTYDLSSGWDFGADTLVGQSFQLKQSVIIKNYTNAGDKVTADILMAKLAFSNYPFMKSAGLGVEGTIVSYQNTDFIKLATIADGKIFKKLFLNSTASENYLIRINYPGRPSAFYPLNSIIQTNKTNGHKDLCKVERGFKYILQKGIEGKVMVGGVVRGGVRVEVSINPSDILDNGNGTTSFTTVTDLNGNYGIYEIPPLKPGALIKIAVTDATLRLRPFVFTASLGNELNTTYDINLVNDVYTATGRLLNQDKKPIDHAMITVEGSTEQPVFTSPDGFYLVKVHGYETAKIKFQLDGQQEITKQIIPNLSWNISGKCDAIKWSNAIHNTKQVIANAALFQPLNGEDADLFNKRVYPSTLQQLYTTYFNQTEIAKGVIDMDSTILTLRKYDFALTVNYKDKNGRLINNIQATVELNGSKFSTAKNLTYRSQLLGGHYTMRIVGAPEYGTLVPWVGDFDMGVIGGIGQLLGNGSKSLTVTLEEGIKLSGQVKVKFEDKLLDSVLISVKGFPIETYTDRLGNYDVAIPIANNVSFSVSKKNYNTFDTTFNCTTSNRVDFQLERRDSTLPQINTISGFPVTIDRIVKKQNDQFAITGKLKLTRNAVFDPENSDEELTFTNAIIVADTKVSGNAIPIKDIAFDEATLSAKAFGFVPVEMEGMPQITMKGLSAGTDVMTKAEKISWEHTAIVGSALNARFSALKKVAGYLPLGLYDAELKYNDSGVIKQNLGRDTMGLSSVLYMYSAPNYKINALSSNLSFAVKFDSSSLLIASKPASGTSAATGSTATGATQTSTASTTPKPSTTGSTATGATQTTTASTTPKTPASAAAQPSTEVKDSVEFALCYLFGMRFPQDKISLSGDGITLENGRVKFNNLLGGKALLNVEKFIINSDLNIGQIKFGVSPQKPLTISMSRVRANLTSISLFGVGSPNAGLGFYGSLNLLKDTTSAGNTQAGTQTSPTAPTASGQPTRTQSNSQTTNTASQPTSGQTTPTQTASTPAPANRRDSIRVGLELIKIDGGISFKGIVTLDTGGLSIGSLVFKTPGASNSMTLSYNSVKQSVQLKASGILDYRKSIAINTATTTTTGTTATTTTTSTTTSSTTAGSTNTSNTTGNTGTGTTSTTGATTAQTSPNAAGPVMSGLFPIQIETFELTTGDFSMLLVAKSNLKLKLGPVAININKLLVSVGNGKTADELNAYMIDGTGQQNSIGTAGPEDQLNEASVSWAIGLRGEIEFGVKGIFNPANAAAAASSTTQTGGTATQTSGTAGTGGTASAATPSGSTAGGTSTSLIPNKGGSIGGSVLIASVNNKIEVRINEIAIGMETPTFTLSGKVKMAFSGSKTGMEGEVAFTTISKTFEAGFKFYQINASAGVDPGYEIGARIKAGVDAPIGAFARLYSFGGGFDFNTSDKTYMVFIEGDIGPNVPKASAPYYVKSAYIKVLFDLKNCGNYPVVEGGGTFMKKAENGVEWKQKGSLGIKLDFCRNMYMLSVGYSDTLFGFATLDINGLFVGMSQKVNGVDKAVMFLGVNAAAKVFNGMMDGNVTFCLGVNYNSTAPGAPSETQQYFDIIKKSNPNALDANRTVFNGFYIGGGFSNKGSGTFDAKVINIYWKYSFSAKGYVYYKFTGGDFGFNGSVSASGSAWAYPVGIYASVSGSAYLGINGQRKTGKWHIDGNGRISLSICDIGFGVGLGFVYDEGRPIKVNINL